MVSKCKGFNPRFIIFAPKHKHLPLIKFSMAIVGNHPIGYRVPNDSRLHELAIDLPYSFSETDFTIIKKFGTDRWTLQIGDILSQMITEINKNSSGSASVIRLKNIEAPKFSKGLMQWSRHSINIRMDYELCMDGDVLKSGEVSGSGSGSGAEFGFLTYIPVLGNNNFDKGIEVAVFRCLQDCLFKIQAELQG